MLSLSSNCCRVDAVKASANQLKMQLASGKVNDARKPQEQSASEKLQSLDAQIKSGDANKAELALSSAKQAVEQLQYTQSVQATSSSDSLSLRRGSLSVYA